ncbi:AhpC/TSA family protein [Lacinutrix sp. C3R15]|uniref:TlpA disulfide reductase family protein n=1 Tax=Flavobacteriaceae TaxID=49546 RepID=UPI001C08F54E|nr:MULTISPECIES: TlpA disulfide reductase family protein [Flavobacteriaceae]MBU2938584.1 AhpC/TSA family protein [Lacinutrix sp. C3R15]MDO6621898.1 TlpA disulfide reductase family protein [Oceanihabitans sp. 1_MG-2023]
MRNKFPHFLVLSFILIGLTSCTKEKSIKVNENTKVSEALVENEFIVRGTTFNTNLNTAYIYKVESDTLTLLDTIYIKEKTFTYKGVAKNPVFYAIKIDESDVMYKFLVDASEINMFLHSNLFLSSTSSNSETQKVYIDYKSKMDAFDYKERELFLKYKSPQTASKRASLLNTDLENLQIEKIAFVKQFIESNNNSNFIPFVFKENYHSFSTKSLRKLHDTLTANVKKIPAVKLLDKDIANLEEKEAQQSIKPIEYRPMAYALSGPNTNGQTITLASLKGKVVLIDFWASWCAPCRATNPNLVQLYKQYKNEEFVILSISEDKAEPEWLSAIETDNLSWNTHILDKNKSIAFRYGVASIPYKILIDKQGRIASDKISGTKLDNRIKVLLKE